MNHQPESYPLKVAQVYQRMALTLVLFCGKTGSPLDK